MLGVTLLLAVSFQVAAPDRVGQILTQAYEALKRKDLEAAVAGFRLALEMDASRVRVHRDLGYALLRMGETEQAVSAFETYERVHPGDAGNQLELAYLYVQVKQEDRALALFRKLAEASDAALAAQARGALENLEGPMLADIARWRSEVQAAPDNPDTRESLAAVLARHGDHAEAVREYQVLRKLAPARHRILLTLAELTRKAGDPATARAYFLLAWRSPEPRIAAVGREGFGNRYPFASELEKALELEPRQQYLRRELGYLYLELRQTGKAIHQFETALEHDPTDELSRRQLELLRAAGVPPPENTAYRHKEQGYANLRASYLPAAAAEFEAAHRLDPNDHRTVLQLGYIYNSMQRDDLARPWFRMARASSDLEIAAQAARALKNIEAPFRRVRHSLWIMPLLSSRFDSAFGYGQFKTEFRGPRLPFTPYLSLRLEGDSRTRTGGPQPNILSAQGVVAALGVGRPLSRRIWAWAEAGNALTSLGNRPPGLQRSEPDYRGGLAFQRVWGPHLFSGETGRFVDTNVDAVYLSRFGHNAVLYAQTKTGYQLPAKGGLSHQPYLAVNLVADARGDAYNNLAEFGPGYRFAYEKWRGFHAYFVMLRGIHTIEGRRSRRTGPAGFWDARLVLWYSKTF
jgi:Flp pilus assembly protein TadD